MRGFDELKSAYLRMKSQKVKEKEDLRYIEYVCDETGWPFEKAKDAMDTAKKDGISYKYYAKRKMWAKTEKEMEKAKRNISHVTERNRKEKEHAIEEIIAATGWTRSKALEMFRAAKLNCGCCYKDYYKFKLYDRTPEEQREYLTLKISEEMLFKYNKDPEALNLLLYKGRFAKEFTDLFHRKWFINRNLSFEKFLKSIEGVEDLICKPTSATQGKGIIKVHCGKDADKKAVYQQLIGMDKRMICEERIIQHPDIAAFNTSSVNTGRVLTIMKDDQCHHVYAGFRMGRGGIVDNFHAGGVIASVDPKTGVTCTDAVDVDGNHYAVHPGSQLPVLGFQIPHWDQVLSLTEQAARRIKGVGMIGWDVAITEKGVCLIEGNSQSSYQIIQLPYVDAGIGMKKLFTPFLD